MTNLAMMVTSRDRTDFDVSMILAALEFAGAANPAQIEQIRTIIANKSPERIHFLRELANEIIDELTERTDDDLCINETFSCKNVSAVHLCEVANPRPRMRLKDLA
ncbi:MAG: hypothetical protein ABIS59_03335 [Candidatus Saccharibacteria bacterium]